MTPTEYLFTGQRLEEEIGLYYYNARWYDPVLGRFAQADTLIPEPGNPLSWDQYVYVLNNPVRYTDPSGHFTFAVDPASPMLPINPLMELLRSVRSPLHGRYSTSGFGGFNTLEGPGFHPGVDLGPPGDVYAAAPGIVVKVTENKNADLGILIVVEHCIGEQCFYSMYAHLKDGSPQVKEGDPVTTDTILGYTGNTGTVSVHLHFEVRTRAGVLFKPNGDFDDIRRGEADYWMDNEHEMALKWVDIGPLFGYDKNYPYEKKPCAGLNPLKFVPPPGSSRKWQRIR